MTIGITVDNNPKAIPWITLTEEPNSAFLASCNTDLKDLQV